MPIGPLAAVWLGALAFAALLLAALEADYRFHGQRPQIPDSEGVLAIVARDAMSAPNSAVIIAGSSRALRGLDAATMSAALDGRRVFQLAQPGISCLPVLEQIARASTFSGTVVCGVEPTSLFGEDERVRERTGLPLLRLPSATWVGLIDVRLSIVARSHLSILGLDIRTMAKPILGLARWPAPGVLADPFLRKSMLHFTGVDTAAADARSARLYETTGGQGTTPLELQQTIAYVAGLAAQISRRGGRVIFVELPSSGRTRAVEERRYPRDRYWDRFASTVGAPTLNSADQATLSAFRCPDGSHLDSDDTPAY
ncbi:MAG TPA: hypothetical protein VGQ30_01650, partial [Gemmatimonadaceae bacterium]|nr:hypothetical protein [Gemmatimonadaceae bacterium]